MDNNEFWELFDELRQRAHIAGDEYNLSDIVEYVLANFERKHTPTTEDTHYDQL